MTYPVNIISKLRACDWNGKSSIERDIYIITECNLKQHKRQYRNGSSCTVAEIEENKSMAQWKTTVSPAYILQSCTKPSKQRCIELQETRSSINDKHGATNIGQEKINTSALIVSREVLVALLFFLQPCEIRFRISSSMEITADLMHPII